MVRIIAPSLTPHAPRRTNPYVGPRAFQPHHTLYGRDRELIELTDMLISERVVVLHAPSGAGKTSLIQAGVLRELRDHRFTALPPARVNERIPAGLQPRAGRYAFSVMLSIESALHVLGPDASAAQLASYTLPQYLERVARQRPPSSDSASWPLVLIIDQFEELLVLDPTDVAGREEFVSGLGDLLAEQPVWLLLAMREEFLGGLENVADLIPTGLAMRYRLDLLQRPAAKEAIRRPAIDGHRVDFTEEAADRLLDNLCKQLVQSPGSAPEARDSPYVEGVILQTVLFNLWSVLDPVRTRKRSIEASDLGTLDHVDRALREHYRNSVAAAASKSKLPERVVRDWFETQLLTEQGFRSQADKGPGTEPKKADKCLKQLEKSHLVRSEARLNRPWWELVHDRFITPVTLDNEEWRRSHELDVIPLEARRWSESHRASDLLEPTRIPGAEAWLAAHDDDAYDDEREFVHASSEAASAQLDRGNKEALLIDAWFDNAQAARRWRRAAAWELVAIVALLVLLGVVLLVL